MIRNLRSTLFIHSQFKTGSTYIWGKFTSIPNYTAFYEPLHHQLSTVTNINYGDFSKVDRVKDSLEKGSKQSDFEIFFGEYKSLLREEPGIQGFEDDFIIRDFFNVTSKESFLKYIKTLKRLSKGKTILQFNRTSGRMGWFSKTFPRDLHVYLVRNPRDQWQSSVKTNLNSVFETINYMILCEAETPSQLTWLGSYIPLLKFEEVTSFAKKYTLYRKAIERLKPEQKYLIHFSLWLYGLLEAEKHGVTIADMNLLSKSKMRSECILKLFADYGFYLDISDLSIPEYDDFRISHGAMEIIETKVISEFLKTEKNLSSTKFLDCLAPDTLELVFGRQAETQLKELMSNELLQQEQEMKSSIYASYSELSLKYEILNRKSQKAFFDLNKTKVLLQKKELELNALREQLLQKSKEKWKIRKR